MAKKKTRCECKEVYKASAMLTLEAKHFANTGKGKQFLRKAIKRLEDALEPCHIKGKPAGRTRKCT